MIFHARGGEAQTEFPTKPFSIRALESALNVCVIECFQPEKTTDAFSADISLFSSVCSTERLVVQISEAYAVVSDRHRSHWAGHNPHHVRRKGLLREISFEVDPNDSVLRMGRLGYGVDRVDCRFKNGQQSSRKWQLGVLYTTWKIKIHTNLILQAHGIDPEFYSE